MSSFLLHLMLLSGYVSASVNPLCIEVYKARAEDPGVIAGKTIAFDETDVVYDPAGVDAGKADLQRYSKLHAEPVTEFDTARIVPLVEGKPQRFNLKNGKGHVVLLHGHMGQTSHSGSWLKVIPTLAGLAKAKIRRGEINLGKLLSETSWYASRPMSVEAPDSPLHGAGPSDVARYSNIDVAVEWYASYLEKTSIELESTGQPLIVMARSSAVTILLAALERYPERLKPRIQAIVLLGAFHPKAGYEEALSMMEANIPEKDRNQRSVDWITKALVPQMIAPSSKYDWTQSEFPFKDIPTLALFGENDREMPPQMLAEFNRLITLENRNQPLTRLQIIPGAGHDPLKPEPPEVALRSWEEVYRFLDQLAP